MLARLILPGLEEGETPVQGNWRAALFFLGVLDGLRKGLPRKYMERGRSVSGCREHGLQFDGHVYLFTDESTLEKFRSNPRYYADRALQAMRSAAQTAGLR